MFDINEKAVIITGCSSGVGEATAKLFAKQGAKLIICARRTDMLNDVASQIKSAGGEVTALTADISKAEDALMLVHARGGKPRKHGAFFFYLSVFHISPYCTLF